MEKLTTVGIDLAKDVIAVCVLDRHGAAIEADRPYAEQRWRQSIDVAEKCACALERARTLLEMGRRLGDRSLVEKARDTFSQVGAKVYLASALHALAQLDARSGAGATDALRRYDQAIAALEEVKANYELGVACAECARLQLRMDQHEEARSNFAKALALFKGIGAAVEQGELQRELTTFAPV